MLRPMTHNPRRYLGGGSPEPCLLFLAAALVASAGFAEDKRPMTIVDLIDVPGIGSPRISPDGGQLLYTRSDTDWKKNGRTTHIRRIGMDGTGRRPVDLRREGGA